MHSFSIQAFRFAIALFIVSLDSLCGDSDPRVDAVNRTTLVHLQASKRRPIEQVSDPPNSAPFPYVSGFVGNEVGACRNPQQVFTNFVLNRSTREIFCILLFMEVGENPSARCPSRQRSGLLLEENSRTTVPLLALMYF